MNALLLLVPLLPLLLALAATVLPRPLRLLPWAPAPALAALLVLPAGTSVELPPVLLGAVLRLDATGAVFLALAALLWTAGGLYAIGYLGDGPRARSFCAFWNLTAAGSLGSCLAADAVSFYVTFAFLSLAAWVLVVHERTPGALRAGRIYIALAVLGEIGLLAGLLLGVQAAGEIGMPAVRAALAEAPLRDLAVACLLLGLGLKAGLVPLHGWLPLAHSAAPVPASAVLSGAIVKAGVLGLLRLLPADAALPGWPELLTWLGIATAWAGIAFGLAQPQPKVVLAYSTMSQMGLLVALAGAGLAQAGAASQAALYAVHHGLTKGALFLAVGLLAAARGRLRLLLLAAVAALGAAMAGLPLTGGALAKLAGKGPLGDGLAALFAGLSAVGTMGLMLRLLWLVRTPPDEPHGTAAPSMLAAFALLALAALVLPWWLFSDLAGKPVAEAWTPAVLWAGAWPVAAGTVLALLAAHWGRTIPGVPAGDLAAWMHDRLVDRTWPVRARPWPGLRGQAERLAARGGRLAEALAGALAQWSAGAAGLGLVALLLGAALLG